MTPEYLQHFIAVCDCGSIQSASKKLFISPQGLGQRIQRLEKMVGIQLLERSNSGVRPTEFGRQFYAQAVAVEREMQKLDALIEAYNQKRKKRVRIGMLGKSKFLDGIMACRELHLRQQPESDVELEICTYSDGDVQIEALHAGELDISLMFHWLEHQDLRYYPISGYSRLMLLTSATGPLSGQASVSWEQLRGLQFVIAGDEDPFAKCVCKLCDDHGFTPDNLFYSTENSFISYLVDHNMACILLRECYCDNFLRYCSNAVAIPIEPELRIANSFVVNARSAREPSVQMVLHCIVDYFKNVMGMGVECE